MAELDVDCSLYINKIPHILLRTILTYLKSNVDRICFSLTCKRLYNDRGKYFAFNTKNISLQSNRVVYKNFHLGSYKTQLFKSLLTKADCSLEIVQSSSNKYDYEIYHDSLHSYNSFPINCSLVVLNTEFDESDLNYVGKLFARSKITSVVNYVPLPSNQPLSRGLKSIVCSDKFSNPEPGCFPAGLEYLELDQSQFMITKVGLLPKSLKSLKTERFNQKLIPGCLPSGLLRIEFIQFNQLMTPGCFPEGLKELVFGPYFDKPFDAGIFPISLKMLSGCSRAVHKFKKGSLPPNLESLKFDKMDPLDPEDSLPASLVTLECAPVSWIPQIRKLTNLKNLSMSTAIKLVQGDIPAGVTRLELKYCRVMLDGSVIPPSVKHLHLSSSQCNFPEGSALELEELVLSKGNTIEPSLANIKMQRLTLRGYTSATLSRAIGVGSIDLIFYNPVALPTQSQMEQIEKFIHRLLSTNIFLHSGTQLKMKKNKFGVAMKIIINPTERVPELPCCKIRELDNEEYLLVSTPNNHLIGGIFRSNQFEMVLSSVHNLQLLQTF